MTVRPVSADEMLRQTRIPSGFRTDRVLDVERRELDGVVGWTLVERTLSAPFTKVYDSGRPGEMLAACGENPLDLDFLVAERDGQTVGWVTYKEQDWNDTIWLVDIRIRERERGQGIGTALLARVIERAREGGRRGVQVETQNTNVPAIQFYRRHGFHIAGFNERLYGNTDLEDGDMAIFLFLPLPH